MTVKKIREELDALRQELAAPSGTVQPSAREALIDRLNGLASRMGDRNATADYGELASWWREKFGRDLRP